MAITGLPKSPYTAFLGRYRGLRHLADSKGAGAKQLARNTLQVMQLKEQGFTSQVALELAKDNMILVRMVERTAIQHKVKFKVSRHEAIDLVSMWNQTLTDPKEAAANRRYFPTFISGYFSWRLQKTHPRMRADRERFVREFFDQNSVLKPKVFHADVLPCFVLSGLSAQDFSSTYQNLKEENILNTTMAQHLLIRLAIDEMCADRSLLPKIKRIFVASIEPSLEWIQALETRIPKLKTVDPEARAKIIEANIEREVVRNVGRILIAEFSSMRDVFSPASQLAAAFDCVVHSLGNYDNQVYAAQIFRRWFALV